MEEPSILSVFAEQLARLNTIEMQVSKLYLKWEKVAYTPELSKALSPVSNDSEQHLKRLSLIKLSIAGQKTEKNLSNYPIQALKVTTKNASNGQDLLLIQKALELQNLKLSFYEFLHPISVAMALQNEAELLEQSITDNRNTNTWLRQIVQKVIAPVLPGVTKNEG